LRLLGSRLGADGRDVDHVLSLTFFVDATDPDAYALAKEEVHALVRETFGPHPPPASVVAQPPEDGRSVALEAAVLAGGRATVERRTVDGLRYTVVTGEDARQVHGGSASERGMDTAARAKEAFAGMEAVLDRERLTYGDVVRQWNYIERMLDVRAAGRQGYQAFNDVRTLAYGRSEFPFGYPAATGIGQAAGGVVLQFIALDTRPDVRVVPLSNPRQVDAHHYSSCVLVGEALDELPGKSPPKFERAKLVARGDRRVLFVSGTAAILGEESVGASDVAAQTETTIENIAELVGGAGLSHLRAYVKRAEDIPVVRRVCEAAYGPIPALYVRADVCRDELLVELEGALVENGGEIGGTP
jgi:enamine deaminase RidA (YjgF/YER057c/UK114 family)